MNLASCNSGLEAAFNWVWQASLAASLLIGLVLVLQFLFGKALPPRWQYWMWLLVVLRLALPASPPSRLSIFNLRARSLRAEPGGPRAKAPASPPVQPLLVPLQVARGGTVPSFPPPAAMRANPPPQAARLTVMDAVRLLWLLGVAVGLLRVVRQQLRVARWVRRQVVSDDLRVLGLLEAASRRLGLRRDVSVVATDSQTPPAIFGVFRPRLLLPQTVLQDLSDDELRLVMLHELTHVRRHDVLINWVAMLAGCLHWFNPAVWLAMRRLRTHRELACDAEVLSHLAAPEDRHAYGRTLIRLLAHFSEPSPSSSLATIINHQHDLERRITMIAQFKSRSLVVSTLSAIVLLALGALTFTRAAEKAAASPPAASASKEAAPDKEQPRRERVIQNLKAELARLDTRIQTKTAALDSLRRDLNISDLDLGETSSGQSPTGESLRRLSGMRAEYAAMVVREEAQLNSLKNMDRLARAQALPTALPVADARLNELLTERNIVEQKRATLESGDMGPLHPEMIKVKASLQSLDKQIDVAVAGILNGLESRVAQDHASLSNVEAEVAKVVEADVKAGEKRHIYLQAKTELEKLQQLRELLQSRLIQEEIDAGVPLDL